MSGRPYPLLKHHPGADATGQTIHGSAAAPPSAAGAWHGPAQQRGHGASGPEGIGSIETILDDKPYFTSGTPCGAEETVYAFLSSAACPMFTSHLRKVIETHANLMTYIERMTNRYFPELAKRA